jgi:hypothetical protein
MNMIRLCSALAVGALFAASVAVLPAAPAAAMQAADASGISGTWTTSFDSQVGKQTYTYTFKVEGGKLTGHSKSNFGESDLTGTADKDKVTFVENLNYQGQALVITYTGQVVSGNEIKFKRDVGGQGGEEFTATRQK